MLLCEEDDRLQLFQQNQGNTSAFHGPGHFSLAGLGKVAWLVPAREILENLLTRHAGRVVTREKPWEIPFCSTVLPIRLAVLGEIAISSADVRICCWWLKLDENRPTPCCTSFR